MGKPIPDALTFRARAIERARTGGLPQAQVARGRGVKPETLRWSVKQVEIDAVPRDGRTTDEKAKRARLRRAVVILADAVRVMERVLAGRRADLPGLARHADRRKTRNRVGIPELAS